MYDVCMLTNAAPASGVFSTAVGRAAEEQPVDEDAACAPEPAGGMTVLQTLNVRASPVFWPSSWTNLSFLVRLQSIAMCQPSHHPQWRIRRRTPPKNSGQVGVNIAASLLQGH